MLLFHRLSIVFVLALLSGCVALYQPPQGANTAKLNISHHAFPRSPISAQICVNNTPQRLEKDSSGYATIAAGQRVTIIVPWSMSGGNVIVSCAPRQSFIPVAGERYYIDFSLENRTCYMSIFKENPSKRTGLELERTVERSSECSR